MNEPSEPPAVAGGQTNRKTKRPSATAGGSDCQFISKNLALDYMNSENWLKVEELLNAALEIEPSRRRRFLDDIGADGLRSEVESLLDCELKPTVFSHLQQLLFQVIFLTTSRLIPLSIRNREL